jgi:nitrogen-specific signal transduction histidine kinase
MGQIFTPFFSTKATGPGLGLAVARQIVNQHQGRIDAEAEPDRVRFTLHLPPPPSRKRAK